MPLSSSCRWCTTSCANWRRRGWRRRHPANEIVWAFGLGHSLVIGPWSLGIVVRPLQPKSGLRVARHPPIAARRKTDRADLGAVGETRAFELACEEPFNEDG